MPDYILGESQGRLDRPNGPKITNASAGDSASWAQLASSVSAGYAVSAGLATSAISAVHATSANVAEGIRETGGPTTLTAGAVADAQVLARSGTTYAGVARAGIDPDATTHAASDGSGHADVATNTAWVAKGAQYDSGTAGAVPVYGASAWGEASGYEWIVDLSGTYDWQANGDGSTDPTSGLTATDGSEPGGVTDFTTLEVGSGVITFDTSDVTQDVGASLSLTLPGLPPMYQASSFFIEADIDLVDDASNFDTDSDLLFFGITNPDATERVYGGLWGNGAGDIRIRLSRTLNGAASDSGLTIITNSKNAGRVLVSDTVGDQRTQFYESTGHNLTAQGLTETTMHCRDGASRVQIYMRSKQNGRVAGTISNIKVTIR